MRRGDVGTALLIALLDGPGHGYELMQVLETKTGGRWKPSPGSVYPTLQALADEGFVTSTDVEGKRVFAITEAGQARAAERVDARGLPWDDVDDSRGDALRHAVRSLHDAARQVAIAGSADTVERAVGILTQARRDLYLLLAES